MDHHCPWVSNCIGFNNRKIFILLLTYGTLAIWYSEGLLIPLAYDSINLMLVYKESQFDYILIGTTFFWGGMSILMMIFLNFHIKLLFHNSTTIEQFSLGSGFNQYDVGLYENFTLVFGVNYWLWPFPIYLSTGLPRGNGIKFEKCVWPSGIITNVGNPEASTPVYTPELSKFQEVEMDTDISFIVGQPRGDKYSPPELKNI